MIKTLALAAAVGSALATNNQNNNNQNNPRCPLPTIIPQHLPKNPVYWSHCPPLYEDPQRTNMQLFEYGFPQISCNEYPTFCQLLEWQPNIKSLFGISDGNTVLVPNEFAFGKLFEVFPAFFAWIRALPDCFGFNRLEYFLKLHSLPLKNVTCQFADRIPGRMITTRSFDQSEYLTFSRILRGGPEALAYLVDNSCFFDFNSNTTGHVLQQYMGYNGGLFIIDKVLRASVHNLAIFPNRTLFEIMANHTDLSIFYSLIVHLDLDYYLRIDPATAQLYSTVFAPVNSAFHGVNISYLFSPYHREEVTRWVLSHFLAGQTYLYQCPIFRSNQVIGNTTLLTEAGTYITFSGTNQVLSLRYGRFNTSGVAQANTIAPWVDIEATDGLLHKINAFLMPPPIPSPSPLPSSAPEVMPFPWTRRLESEERVARAALGGLQRKSAESIAEARRSLGSALEIAALEAQEMAKRADGTWRKWDTPAAAHDEM